MQACELPFPSYFVIPVLFCSQFVSRMVLQIRLSVLCSVVVSLKVLPVALASYSSLPYFRFQSSAFTSNSLFYSVGFLLAKAASAQLQQRSIDGKIETGYRNKQRLVAPDNCQSCQKHELKTKMCQFYTSCCRECLLQLWVLVLTSKQSLTPTHNGYFRLQLSSLNQQDKLCFTECACMCCSCTATCKKKFLTPELLCRLFLKF